MIRGMETVLLPRNTDVDLELYLEEMMKYPRKSISGTLGKFPACD